MMRGCNQRHSVSRYISTRSKFSINYTSEKEFVKAAEGLAPSVGFQSAFTYTVLYKHSYSKHYKLYSTSDETGIRSYI